MKLLVTGAVGMLGCELMLAAGNAGHEVVSFGRTELDVADAEQTKRKIAGLEATRPRFTVPLLGANALLTLLVYAPFIGVLPSLGFSPLLALVAAASLVGVLAIGLSEPGARADRAADTRL
jgi:hypothetical protein